MKIAIYDPYLDTLGGGERYMLTAAGHWSLNHQVDIFWNDSSIIENAFTRLSIDLKRVNFLPNIFTRTTNLFERYQILRNYDLLFYLSDGSIPLSFSQKTFLHFQVPFHNLSLSLVDRLKISRINGFVCNSLFTKRFIDKTYGVNSQVIYPPVDIDQYKSNDLKENIILSVGRFNGGRLNAKKQDVLIKVFKEISSEIPDWKLVLIGGVQFPEDEIYLHSLKESAQRFPIEFYPNANHKILIEFTNKAKIYWHAAGFDINENLNPENTEHFGISVVEAMSAGGVPIVTKAGGLPEIVRHQANGLLWQTTAELQKNTLDLITNPSLLNNLSKSAVMRANLFSQEKFCQEIDKLLQ